MSFNATSPPAGGDTFDRLCTACGYPAPVCQCATTTPTATTTTPATAAGIPFPAAVGADSPPAARTVVAPRWAALGETRSHATITAVFYLVCLGAAAYGQVLVGIELLNLPLLFAVLVAVALELAAVKFAIDAAIARKVGEHAAFPQLMSYTIASVAIGVNVVGHVLINDYFGAAIYGLFSALAFIAFTIRSEFRRRQADRAAGRAAHTTPAYGLRRWVSDRAVTRRAKQLAEADPRLGLYGSLDEATRQLDAEKRRAELAELLRTKATKDFAGDKLRARIEVAKYDLDVIATQLCQRANHTAAVDAIEADLKRHSASGTTTASGTPIATQAKATKPKRSTTKTRTKAAKTTRTDAQLLDVLAGVERDQDGTVPVRRAARALGCGPDRARRLLAEAGLLKPTNQ